jgi:ABC-type Fe3+ transport system permease subunit
MMAEPNVVILADHSVWLAVPAFAPAIVVAGVVVYVAVRNRRKGDTARSDGSAATNEDGAP